MPWYGRSASGVGKVAAEHEDFEIPFLREIYRPEGEPSIDLVFVHGLNPFGNRTHAWDTWRHADGPFWPTDFLPDDIPHARVMLYGYNSNVAFDVSEARIKHHAEELLNRLDDKREESTCRIVFIAHSLGGLVVKQALLNARDNPVFDSILRSTYGFMFFGVPHRGASGAAFGDIGAKIAQFVSGGKADNDLLDCLKKNSLFTRDAADRFSHQLENYHVVSYFETIPMTISGGGISFHKAIVVDEDSAILLLPGTRERRLPLNADHSGMCKIARKGDLYEGVMANLKRLVRGAINEERLRGNDMLSADGYQRGRSASATNVRNVAPVPSPSRTPERPALLPARDTNDLEALGLGRNPAVDQGSGLLRRPRSVNQLNHQREEEELYARPQPRNLPYGVTSSSNFREAESSPTADEILQALLKTTLEDQAHSQGRQQTASAASVSLMADLLAASARMNQTNERSTLPLPNALPEAQQKLEYRPESEPEPERLPEPEPEPERKLQLASPTVATAIEERAFILPPQILDHSSQAGIDGASKSTLDFSKSSMKGIRDDLVQKGVSEDQQQADLMSLKIQQRRDRHERQADSVSPYIKQQRASEAKKTSSNVEEPKAEVEEIPPPYKMVIPPCAVCAKQPQDFPVYTCQSCYGKTTICPDCAPNMHLYPKHVHTTEHNVREWQDGLWYHMAQLFIHTLDAPKDPIWGPQFSISQMNNIQLGNQAINGEVLVFGPQPRGLLRLAITRPPPGQWEICFQVRTWQSPWFGDTELQQVRTTKKWGIQFGTTALGMIGFGIGTPRTRDAYLDDGEGDPVNEWQADSAGIPVTFGQKTMLKIKMPRTFVIKPGKDLGILAWHYRNDDGFAKEKDVVRQRLSFCWALEGIRFERHSVPGNFKR
ncbi:MAG: hypothetical protein M1833_003972 [Piccolia ochrophora]|nr:MAG: hypothetical protein M1833_003972 [Piccolia ochrophora]